MVNDWNRLKSPNTHGERLKQT